MTTQPPGSEIAGYRIESLIGRGGMAVVYRAEDLRLGRKVAMKLLSPQLADNEQFRQRFVMESRLAASLDHPNIVPIFEAGEADGQLFIAMRYVVGSDLKKLLTEVGPLTPDRTLRLLAQIGDALDSAHGAGLVHRDVKPGNILVAAGPERPGQVRGDHVYLTDFGLTKRTSALTGGLTGTGHFLGTVDYVSPEQIQGRPVGPRTDLYALGCVAYECLTGHLPFRREEDAALLWAHLVEPPPPVTATRPEIPAAVNAVVARAMAKDPADRYASCEEFVDELEQALGTTAPAPTFPAQAEVRHETAPRDVEPDVAEVAESPEVDDDRGAGQYLEEPPAPSLVPAAGPPLVLDVDGAPPPMSVVAPRSSRSGRGGRAAKIVVVGLLTLVLGAGAAGADAPGSATATEVVAEPADSPGEDPFTEPVTPAPASASTPAAEVPAEDAGSPGSADATGSADAVVPVSGDAPGLYGGTGAEACDAELMAGFFETHPERAAAWAGAQEIEPDGIRDFLESLTPVVLRTDTAVTNHGFRHGTAQAYQAVLQAGSAVLIDGHGVPRVRCSCGNPLLAPTELEAVEYTGQPWPELRDRPVTVVEPAPAAVDRFVVVQQDTTVVVDRPRGTAGEHDQPVAPEVAEEALAFRAADPASAGSGGGQPAEESASTSSSSSTREGEEGSTDLEQGTATDLGTDPGTGEGTDPGTGEGTDPGRGEGSDPGTDPGTGEGTDPGTGPGTGDGTDPGTDPGTGEGTDPGTDPGTGEGTDPGTGEGTDPGTDPDPGTDTDPGTGSDAGTPPEAPPAPADTP